MDGSGSDHVTAFATLVADAGSSGELRFRQSRHSRVQQGIDLLCEDEDKDGLICARPRSLIWQSPWAKWMFTNSIHTAPPGMTILPLTHRLHGAQN